MAKSLKFNSKAFCNAYRQQLTIIANEIMYIIYNHIVRNLSSSAKSDVDIEEAINNASGIIETTITSNWKAVLDSYGVGKGIDTDSLHFDEYKGSKYWNEERKGTAIVGRAEGTYDTIFGERTSSGSMQGTELPFYINASKAIQNEESEWFSGTKVEQEIEAKMSIWINQNINKYFIYS